MGTTRNGKPPTDERGSSLPDHLSTSAGLPYTLRGYGLQDYSKPTAKDLDEALARDGMLQALDYALTLPIGGAKIRVEGKGPQARLVRDNLTGSEYGGGMSTPLSGVVEQMASAVALKRAFFEKVWEYRNGKTRLKKLKMLPVSTCEVVPDKLGEFDGFIQRTLTSSLEGTAFKPEKAFVYFHRPSRKPLEGRSALQTAWHDHEHKVKVRHLQHLHLQMYGLGIKKGKTESENRVDQDSLLNRLHGTQGGGSLALGKGEDADIMTAGGSSEFGNYLSYLDRQMAVSVLAQWLQFGGQAEGGGAAYALSKDHSDFFTQAVDATLREMAEALTRYVVAPLVAYNFGEAALKKKLPEIKLGPVSDTDIRLSVDLFKHLSTAPASRVTEGELHKIKQKAFSAMDIEPDEPQEGEPGEATQQNDALQIVRQAEAIKRGEA